jgi:hypothetical protein
LLKHEPASRSIDCRQVREANIYARLQEPRQKGHGPSEPIYLGDYQRSPVKASGSKSALQLRPIRPASTFDLGALGNDLPTIPVQATRHGLALRLDA